MSTGLCGSEPYIAPEQFAGKRECFPLEYCTGADYDFTKKRTMLVSLTYGHAALSITVSTSKNYLGVLPNRPIRCMPHMRKRARRAHQRNHVHQRSIISHRAHVAL